MHQRSLTNDLGYRLTTARKRAGLSQAQAARLAYRTGPQISMWENGRIVPDDENLEKLAEVYKVNPKWLSCENPLRLTLEQGIQKAGRDVAGMPELDRDEYLMILAALPE